MSGTYSLSNKPCALKKNSNFFELVFVVLFLGLFFGFSGKASAATYNIGPGQTYETFTALVVAQNLTQDDIVDGGGNTFSETWTVDGSGISNHPVTLKNATVTGGINSNSKNYLNITRIKSNGPLVLSGTNFNVNYFVSEYSYGDGITVTGASGVVSNVDVQGASGKGIDAQESCTIENSIVRNTFDANLAVSSGKTVTGSKNRFQDPATIGTGTYVDGGESTWSDTNTTYTESLDWSPSADWDKEYPQYKGTTIGRTYNVAQSTAFSDSFTEANGVAAGWTVKRGTFAVSGNKYTTTGTVNASLSIPTTDYSAWDNYRLSLKVTRLGAVDAAGYADIYFRTTMNGSSDNGYMLTFRNNGSVNMYKRTNGTFDGSALSTITGVIKDNAEHTIIITVQGSIFSVWIDKSDLLYQPDMMVNDTTYTAGTIGIGSSTWHSIFDDVSVTPILNIDASPRHIYTTSSLAISSLATVPLNSLVLTVTTPSGQTFIKNSPTGCSGNSNCTVVFPTDFSGLTITTRGIYKITAVNGTDESHLLLDVREQPLYSFYQITDTHETGNAVTTARLTGAVSSINNQKIFQTPNFVVLSGDISSTGLESQLTTVKNILDTLTVPYYTIVGGHDTVAEAVGDKGHVYENVFGNRFNYTWTLGSYLFIGMNSYADYGGAVNILSDEGREWLQNALSANPTKNKILFTHDPQRDLRDGGYADALWEDSPQYSPQVQAILEGDSKVVANIAGHSHVNTALVTNNILYVTTQSFENKDEYRYVEIYDDRIETHMIPGFPVYRTYSSTTDSDSKHSADLYIFGNSKDRQIKFDLATRQINKSDFTPLSTSPAIDSGTDVSLASVDYAGSSIYGLHDIGAYEYQPPYNMGTNEVDISANVRVYGDGKFRNTETAGGTTADLSVIPQSSQTTKWLDITKADDEVSVIWEANHKKWKESSTTLGGVFTLHTVGDLTAGKAYTLKIDDTLATANITGSDCASGVCTADGTGKITFTYTGGYSNHTFDIDDDITPVITIASPETGGTVSGDDTITFTDTEQTDLECSVDNSAWVNCTSAVTSFSTLTGWSDIAENDTFTLYMRDTDGSGNTGTASVANLVKADTLAPVRSDGSPSGELASGTTSATLSLTTSESATCKYSTTSGTAYASMTESLTTSNGTAHSADISGLSSGNSYNYYVRCQDGSGNANDTDYLISFSIANAESDNDGNTDADNDNEKDLNVHSVKAQSSENTITITWKTDHNTKSSVRYGTDKNLKNKKKDKEKEKKHKIVLKDLLPDTKYYFRIKAEDSDDNEDSSRIHSIKTLPKKTTIQIISPLQEENQDQNQTETETNNTNLDICAYTVQSGDSLWSIAKKVYGDATAYSKIIEKNKDKYPDIESKLSIGQELSFCDNSQTSQNTQNSSTANSMNQQTETQSQPQSETKNFHWWNPFSWF